MTEPGTVEALEAVDIMQILARLPHRYPFLMIDRVIDIRGDESGIGVKNVTINEPYFQGHFPSTPVMPGVLMIEGMAQTGGVLCLMAQRDLTPKLVYFLTIDNAKFRKPVIPGDVVEYHMRKLRQRGSIWKFSGEALVNGKTVAEAEVSAMLRDQ